MEFWQLATEALTLKTAKIIGLSKIHGGKVGAWTAISRCLAIERITAVLLMYLYILLSKNLFISDYSKPFDN